MVSNSDRQHEFYNGCSTRLKALAGFSVQLLILLTNLTKDPTGDRQKAK